MNLVTIDVETTGFDPFSNSIITTGLIINKKSYLIKSRPESKEKWGDAAEKIHGISYETAMSFPSQTHACEELLSLIPSDSKFICHSTKRLGSFFDWTMFTGMMFKQDLLFEWRSRFMNKLDSRMNLASTLIMARESTLQLPNYKLNTVAKYYDLEHDHHDALSDAKVTDEIYRKLICL